MLQAKSPQKQRTARMMMSSQLLTSSQRMSQRCSAPWRRGRLQIAVGEGAGGTLHRAQRRECLRKSDATFATVRITCSVTVSSHIRMPNHAVTPAEVIATSGGTVHRNKQTRDQTGVSTAGSSPVAVTDGCSTVKERREGVSLPAEVPEGDVCFRVLKTLERTISTTSGKTNTPCF